MDTHRFNPLTRLFSGRPLSRRAALRHTGAGLGAVALAHTTAAGAASPFRATRIAPPSAPEAFTITGLVDHPLTMTVADLLDLGLPPETVAVSYLTLAVEKHHTFTGVRLHDLLTVAGITPVPNKRPIQTMLTRYVVITASDAFQVVYSGGELDPNFGNRPVLVAWEQDGQPLTGAASPVRIVSPGETHGGRFIHGVVNFELRDIDA
ncbi:MAG TPA: molybdopterin-dependent oxidoreductase [Thermomicrobiales bacterium]|jgi:DMSO/TMAO reductase YedYZ molybdopterin-dependent catalytic subunit